LKAVADQLRRVERMTGEGYRGSLVVDGTAGGRLKGVIGGIGLA
jgi:hypothetical protein